MEITKTYQGTLDDGEFPPILYKYRDWNYNYHERFVTHREIFMASPSSFEDKLDCKIPIRYDLLNNRDSLTFALKLSKIANPSFTRQQHRKSSREWLKEKLLKNQHHLDKYQAFYFKEHDQRLGILSLTAEPHLEDMWKKYANNSTGFCIGYNSRVLFEYLGGGGAVHYAEELPILLPEPFMDWATIKYGQVFTKEKKWAFEKEYRTQMFWPNPVTIEDRRITLPKEAFNNVILGKNISPKDREAIKYAVKEFIGEIPTIEL